jgi:hypothetical protein
MAKYLLSARVVEFAGTDISGTYTAFNMKATQGEAKREDVSDKGSSTDGEFLTGLRGDKKTVADIEVNDVAGGSANIWLVTLGASGSLIDYPEGKTHGKKRITLTGAVCSEAPNITGGFSNKAAVKAAWYSFSTPTSDTYSSV